MANATALAQWGAERQVVSNDTDATGSVTIDCQYAGRVSIQVDCDGGGTPSWTFAGKLASGAAWVTMATEATVANALFSSAAALAGFKVSWTGNAGGDNVDVHVYAEASSR